MAQHRPIEILDLRHFAAPMLRPVLEAEGDLWRQRLHWDYRISSRLLLQYLDSHMLPGYAAVEDGRVVGYVFCVYEETKAVIGDVFALPSPPGGESVRENSILSLDASDPQSHAVEETMLGHLLELLVNSPQVDRIESQLLLHPSGTYSEVFRLAGFQIYRRMLMSLPLQGNEAAPKITLPGGLELRQWRDEDLNPAGRLIAAAYSGHPDGVINDQYRSVHGSIRFLANIVRYSGCGVFSPTCSHVMVDKASRELVALVLGSRVSPESGHITQICVHPEFRRHGLARMLLSLTSSAFVRLGVGEISLTVTESNTEAIELYRATGYGCAHTFDAAVWLRERIA